jgi:hypothetical protein
MVLDTYIEAVFLRYFYKYLKLAVIGKLPGLNIERNKVYPC